MVVYIEKYVTDKLIVKLSLGANAISWNFLKKKKTIISHNDFKVWKLVKENFKTLRICVYFYFVRLIYSSFTIIKFF